MNIENKKILLSNINEYLASPMENNEEEYRKREDIREQKAKLEAEILHLQDDVECSRELDLIMQYQSE